MERSGRALTPPLPRYCGPKEAWPPGIGTPVMSVHQTSSGLVTVRSQSTLGYLRWLGSGILVRDLLQIAL